MINRGETPIILNKGELALARGGRNGTPDIEPDTFSPAVAALIQIKIDMMASGFYYDPPRFFVIVGGFYLRPIVAADLSLS